MTENEGGESGTERIGIEDVYDHWVKHCGMEGFAARNFAIGQALHPAELNNIPWVEKETPRKIAEFAIGKGRAEVQLWAKERNENHWHEGDKEFDRVRQVRIEVKKILRREKK